MEGNRYPVSSVKMLNFEAILDSSCIYQTKDPHNQADINKLYGFSDSMGHHHTNSARFGWNWMNGEMRLHAYCYVSKERMFKELGTVPLNKKIRCSIEVLPGKYIFTVNGKKDTMLRASQESESRGYMLFPYFGGDESAPHDIHIKIKDLP